MKRYVPKITHFFAGSIFYYGEILVQKFGLDTGMHRQAMACLEVGSTSNTVGWVSRFEGATGGWIFWGCYGYSSEMAVDLLFTDGLICDYENTEEFFKIGG